MKIKSIFKAIFQETRIILVYSIIPTILLKILTLLQWNFQLLISLITLIIFLRITQKEDSRTLSQSSWILLARFSVILLAVYGLSHAIEYFTNKTFALEENYQLKHKAPYFGNRRKPHHNWSNDWKNYDKDKMWLTFWTLVLDYLKFVNILANFRIIFLGMTTTLFVVIQFFMWFFYRNPLEEDY